MGTIKRHVTKRRRSGAGHPVVLCLSAFVAVNVLTFFVLARDHIRTLSSLRHVPGTHLYVMDYYCDYNMDWVREEGIDPSDVEGSLIRAYFPPLIVPIALQVYEYLEPDSLYYRKPGATHSCSTASFLSHDGNTYLGRNFDWSHDPCLLVRVHRHGKPVSVGVLDLYYLNLDRQKLANLSLLNRLPLLFAPYIIEDGMNEYGVAVSGMMALGSQAPFDPNKPSLINPVAKRMMLDDAKTTKEAIALLRQYNVNVLPAYQTHFMICDSTGHSVVVEFVEGEMKVVPAKKRWQLCTNHLLWGRSESDNDRRCNRYLRGSEGLEKMELKTSLDGMMQLMASISAENWTMWTSVYNLSNGEYRVAYRRNYENLYVDRLPTR